MESPVKMKTNKINEIFDTFINEATIEKNKEQEFEENPI
jgi:hypothetical protein